MITKDLPIVACSEVADCAPVRGAETGVYSGVEDVGVGVGVLVFIGVLCGSLAGELGALFGVEDFHMMFQDPFVVHVCTPVAKPPDSV